MRVRYTHQALSDLLAIAEYIREANPAAAIQVEGAVRSAIELLADFPKIGRDRPDLEARALGIPRYPFVMTGESHQSAKISEGCQHASQLRHAVAS